MTDATKDAIERVREWAQGGTANLHPGDVYEAVAELDRLAREKERLQAIYKMRKRDGWYSSSQDDVDLPCDVEEHIRETMRAAEARAERLAAAALRSARKTLICLKTLTPGGSHAYSLIFDTLASIDAGLAALNE